MNEQEILSRIDKNNSFDEYEIREIINTYTVDQWEGEDHRWDREIYSIIQLKDRYFEIEWRRGLTEMQEDSYWTHQFIEVFPYEETKTITIKRWLTKDELVKHNMERNDKW